MVKPNGIFSSIRADEVAECWDGVPKELYAKLWSLPQTVIPNLEDSGPHDHIGHDNLAAQWHLLDDKIAAEMEASYQRYLNTQGHYERAPI